MSTRVHSELRKLALAYYRGWVEREEYLSLRKNYLRSISDDKIPAAIDPKKISAPKKKQPAGRSLNKAKTRRSKWLIIAVICGALLLLVIGVYLGSNDQPTSQPKPSMEDNITPVVAVVQESRPLTDEQRFNQFLTENFVGHRVWQQDTLNSLKLKWLGLSKEQQEVVRTTPTFNEFSGALVERIVDERELSNIVPSDYELTLMTVAKKLGLTNTIPMQ